MMSGYLNIMSNYRAKTEFSKLCRTVRSIYPNELVRASERSERRHNNIIGKTFEREYILEVTLLFKRKIALT